MVSNSATILREEYGFDVAAARETLVQLAGVSPGECVLDVGAGLGSMAIVLARHGLMVDAVDINLQALDEARQRALAVGVATYQRIRFLQAARVLQSCGVVYQRHPLEFVTIFIARITVREIEHDSA